jgi:hypothetical protein
MAGNEIQKRPREDNFYISDANMVENARIYIDKVILMDVWAAFFGLIGLGVAIVESKLYYIQVRFDVLDPNGIV